MSKRRSRLINILESPQNDALRCLTFEDFGSATARKRPKFRVRSFDGRLVFLHETFSVRYFDFCDDVCGWPNLSGQLMHGHSSKNHACK